MQSITRLFGYYGVCKSTMLRLIGRDASAVFDDLVCLVIGLGVLENGEWLSDDIASI